MRWLIMSHLIWIFIVYKLSYFYLSCKKIQGAIVVIDTGLGVGMDVTI